MATDGVHSERFQLGDLPLPAGELGGALADPGDSSGGRGHLRTGVRQGEQGQVRAKRVCMVWRGSHGNLAGATCPRSRLWNHFVMSTRRVALLVTFLAVGVLLIGLTVVSWDDASRIATIVSTVAAVAALGVAVWAALPAAAAAKGRSRASLTGEAVARGKGSSANAGIIAPADGSGEQEAHRTGRADAADGGQANTGIRWT